MRVNEDNWWVYIMLFSTLVPTAVHLFIASWSVLLWLPFAPLLMFYLVYLVLHDWGHGHYLGGELLAFMQELSVDVAAWTEDFAEGFVVPK